MRPIVSKLLFLASLGLGTCALASDEIERTDLGERVPTAEEIVDLLKLPPPLPSRSGGPPVPPPPRAISSAIKFRLNSADLEEAGKEFLNRLGAALSDEALKNSHILLEGHADATGPEELNLDLSTRRAQSVKQYLVDVWGITTESVSTVGKGETDLIDKANPESPANRVVVIVNTGSR